MKFIALDATPLGLLVQPFASPNGDRCRKWLLDKVTQGMSILLPEISDYEVRRELIRANKVNSVLLLNAFIANPQITYLPITPSAMRLAADLWAQARNRGKPTADPHALDADVILAAQVLSAGYSPTDFCIATSNVTHLAQFAPAAAWETI
jgi:predicted nucleic acid-binding protein